jgi:hypothetical protein
MPEITEFDSLGDHTFNEIDPPRAPDPWEARAIERIASWPDTPPNLRAVLAGVRVKAECTACASVRFEEDDEPLLNNKGLPAYGTAPGELWFGEGAGCTHVIVHIADGRVYEMQVYREDGEPAKDRPDVEAMHLTSVLATHDVPEAE